MSITTKPQRKERVKKTRNRIPTSCEVCRKRKLKCDRRHPCSNCVKYHSESLCKYAVQETTSSTPKAKLTSEILRLKLRIKKLERILELNEIDASKYDDISLVTGSGGKSGIHNMEEFNADNVLDQDPMISLTNRFDQLVIKGNRVLHSGTTSFLAFIRGDAQLLKLFKPFFDRHDIEYAEYNRRVQMKASEFPGTCIDEPLAFLTDSTINEPRACTSESLDTSTSNALQRKYAAQVVLVMEKINKIIPPMAAVRDLVDHFFNKVYCMVPYIDEDTFRRELTYVTISMSDGSCKLALAHMQNASIVSLLLIVLRFAYISKCSEEANNANHSYTIGPEFIHLAKDLIMSLPRENSVFKKVTRRNIQVVLMLVLYHSYSPELNESRPECAINLGTLIAMVRIFGGNRDPMYFPNVFKDARENNVYRRMYYEMLYLDALNSFEYGCPLTFHDDEYDVKLPKLPRKETKIMQQFRRGEKVNVSSYNLRRLFIEDTSNTYTKMTYEATLILREGVKAFQNVHEGSKRSSLESVLHKLEDFLNNKQPALTAMIHGNDIEKYFVGSSALFGFFKVPMFRCYELRLHLLSAVNTFYYLLYLNETNTDVSYSSKEKHIALINKYEVKATESALILFKDAYDYARYYTSRNLANTISASNIKYEKFSQGLEPFFMTKCTALQERTILWLFAVILRNLDPNDDSRDLKDIISDFGSSTETLMTLEWFSLDIECKSCTNSKYIYVLLHYFKEYYFLCTSLKEEIFSCWRNTLQVRFFINYLHITEADKFKELMDPAVVFSDSCTPRTGIDNGENEKQMYPTVGVMQSKSLEQLVNSDLSEFFVSDNQQKVDDLLYHGNISEALDRIVAETSQLSDSALNFGMLNNTMLPKNDDFGNIIQHNKSSGTNIIDASPNFSMSVSSTTGSTSSPGTVDPRMVSSSFSSQGTSEKQRVASSASSLTPGNGQPFTMNPVVSDSAVPYVDPSMVKGQEINLADLLSKLQQGSDFGTQ